MKGLGIVLKKFPGKLGSAHLTWPAYPTHSLTVVSLFEVDNSWRVWNGKMVQKASPTSTLFDVCMCVSVL